ncbi:cellular nucleic acid binding protein [Artemisia annua]|uniref:Cellular nucleic acid binding protein n=1 Tax=Artemisia annua TaxID=35608 RepID=A0A2U1Q756_ARTAN|nr:cellular nucleic acid binding protein [Artemisia annua]
MAGKNSGKSVPNSRDGSGGGGTHHGRAGSSTYNDDNVPSCFKCGSYDHIADPCPNEGRVDIKCFNCKKVGHIGWVCPDSCCLCRETGHTGEKCPNAECVNCPGNHVSL